MGAIFAPPPTDGGLSGCFGGILAGPEIMFAVVVFGGFENQNGGGGTGTVFHFWKKWQL